MSAKRINLILAILIFYSIIKTNSRFEFTNLNCTVFDLRVGEFENCNLKSINRSYKYVSGKYKLNQIPLPRMKVNFIMWKRLNGYRPFLYNITADACKFVENPKSNPVLKYIFDSFSAYSNMNHSCPYTSDLIVERLPIGFMNLRVTEILPFPEGNYLFEFHFSRRKSIFASTQVYFTIS
uniref:IP20668p n=1 Tax=Drosophila melanogaster TaxID=7227 RepID=B3DMX2_DROME|nr:IP20668p [Drosophila melanogaster]